VLPSMVKAENFSDHPRMMPISTLFRSPTYDAHKHTAWEKCRILFNVTACFTFKSQCTSDSLTMSNLCRWNRVVIYLNNKFVTEKYDPFLTSVLLLLHLLIQCDFTVVYTHTYCHTLIYIQQNSINLTCMGLDKCQIIKYSRLSYSTHSDLSSYG